MKKETQIINKTCPEGRTNKMKDACSKEAINYIIANASKVATPNDSPINTNHYKKIGAIKSAAGMSGYTREQFQQVMAGLYTHIEYRGKVALELLEVGTEGEAGKFLTELFDYCNEKLKEYLAIL